MQSNIMDLTGTSNGMNNSNNNNNNGSNAAGSDSSNPIDAKGTDSGVTEGSELTDAFKQVRGL